MRIVAMLWSSLLAFAPAMAACACPRERRACERQERGCCGTKAPAPCPRSQPVVDTLDQPAQGVDLIASALDVVLVTPVLEAVEAAPTPSRAADDGRTRASPSRPLFLRISVLRL